MQNDAAATGDTPAPAEQPPYSQGCLEEENEIAMAAPFKQVVVGICAMEKKSRSKPMKEILSRLEEFEFLRPVIFPEDVILKVRGEWEGRREGRKEDKIG